MVFRYSPVSDTRKACMAVDLERDRQIHAATGAGGFIEKTRVRRNRHVHNRQVAKTTLQQGDDVGVPCSFGKDYPCSQGGSLPAGGSSITWTF